MVSQICAHGMSTVARVLKLDPHFFFFLFLPSPLGRNSARVFWGSRTRLGHDRGAPAYRRSAGACGQLLTNALICPPPKETVVHSTPSSMCSLAVSCSTLVLYFFFVLKWERGGGYSWCTHLHDVFFLSSLALTFSSFLFLWLIAFCDHVFLGLQVWLWDWLSCLLLMSQGCWFKRHLGSVLFLCWRASWRSLWKVATVVRPQPIGDLWVLFTSFLTVLQLTILSWCVASSETFEEKFDWNSRGVPH